ncbi:TonB-dependent receptor plug domain-containing protein [Shewanella sp. C32]|uniref:TonB-dependent receptor plug domain-containing protein n=1 Tax=Shewanella electrica TaxID=515560 RepID=A0ABT2FI11_9GAMM|nr:TonB-dependent receptor [Shewanella electrica]MCH1924038.1 TonB-dependent receptor plug domain-containing protein [Shewanella electrica]MCS4555941.1 TonB-dependent receptor plug domain-containing protein [Shewanella electrica]
MFRTSMLSTAVRYSLLLGCVGGFSVYAAENDAAVERTAMAATADAATPMLEEEPIEKVVVTGSRIRKAEFSEASPVQVIDGDISRDLGMFDAASMLQSSTQIAGVQIDNTFGGYVTDNGPGAATIGFRGLGAERTLVMLNGRRMAPAGIGGAPTSPDLNMIPGVMIQRIENLFDGASTVYGSDAVAGVANVILKKDVQGFDITASRSQPKGDGGEETVLSAMWGSTFDNGFVTIGAEYNDQKAISRGGYDFTKGCEERIWETEDGRRITRASGYGPTARGDVDTCDIFPLTNRVQFDNFFGSLYATPGYTNVDVPGFSESNLPNAYAGYMPTWVMADSNGDGIPDAVIVDGNGDGYTDVDLQDPFYAFQNSDYYKSGDYRSRNKRYSFMLNGEYNFQDANNTTVYYEGLYAKRKSPTFDPGAQIFEWVPDSNPFNPCGVYGVNCMAAAGTDWGPVWARPIINIRGDRDRSDIELSQYRGVVGVTGDLHALENIGLQNWYYDTYVSYSASKGTNNMMGISEERLLNSLYTTVVNDDGSITCGDGTDGCVPVNLFASNIYQAGGGTLTDAEYDYLMVERKMETKVNQAIVNGYVGGDLFHLPWNNEAVSSVFGVEWRRDEIETNANDVASQGLLWGWFADAGADGSRILREAFSEMEFPLLKGQPGAEELTFTASGRMSKETYYNTAKTYSLKGVYRPVDWFTIRGTKGTSYRAPNLREHFLNGQTGFSTLMDPCVVPADARVSDPLNSNVPATYDPSLDERDAAVLQRCVASGVDPTSLGLGQNGETSFSNSYSTEVTSGGSEELDPETSVAKTYGFIFEQPFTDAFELTLSATRFDIEVTNSIAEPSASYSIGQCYSADGNAAFCDRLSRGEDGTFDFIDSSFINIGLITSKGYDFNLYYKKDVVLFDNNLQIGLDVTATKMTESVYDVLGTVDDNVGEPDYPEWRGKALLTLRYSDFFMNWQTVYIGKGEEDDRGEFLENTIGCTGLYNDDGSPLRCRPVAYTDDYWTHNLSMGYEWNNYTINLGVRNVFNDKPPKVDPDGTLSNTNIPLGVGYASPRTVFLNLNAKF